MTSPAASSALSGVRVLDLSRLLPGPALTRVLADLGADVIRVESPDGGDLLRHLPPFVAGHGAGYSALNYGKRSVALDLKRPEGVAVFRRLSAAADVVVESFRPGVLERLGVGYETLAAENPRLVMCSLSGFGREGPLAARAGHDLGYVARAGVLSLFGPAGDAPAVPGVQLADLGGGALTGAIGVLAALLERAATGRGRHLDVSLTRGAAAFMSVELARRTAGDADPRGEGLLTGGAPCYGLYRTADGRFMALAALEPKFFDSFCARAGCPELAGSGLARGEEGRRVRSALAAVFARRSQAEWVEALGDADTCCEAVLAPEEALADPGVGLAAVDVAGIRAMATDVGLGPLAARSRDVSALGADGAAVVRELGVPPELVDAAVAAGALHLEALDDGVPREYP